MKWDRRDFLGRSAAAIAAAALGTQRAAAAEDAPVLGLIFPPADRGVPDEGIAMYGDSLKYVVTGLGVERMTPEGFDAVIARVPAAAEKLAAAGAHAIELTGTSLTFYNGEEYNQQLREAVTKASGLRATTMSNGVIEGLKAVGAKNVAVATAYADEINGRLRAFLQTKYSEPIRRRPVKSPTSRSQTTFRVCSFSCFRTTRCRSTSWWPPARACRSRVA